MKWKVLVFGGELCWLRQDGTLTEGSTQTDETGWFDFIELANITEKLVRQHPNISQLRFIRSDFNG